MRERHIKRIKTMLLEENCMERVLAGGRVASDTKGQYHSYNTT